MDDRAAAALKAIANGDGKRFGELSLVIRNPRTLSSKLRLLESQGLVLKSGGVYLPTQAGRKAASLVTEIERLVGGDKGPDGFDRIPHQCYQALLRDYVRLLSAQYGVRLVGVVLFGSVARGDWKIESDMDLLVVVKGWREKGDRDRLEELAAVKSRLARTASYADAMRKGFAPAIQELPLDPLELANFRTIYLDVALDGLILADGEGAIGAFVGSTKEGAKARGWRRVVSPDGGFHWMIPQNRAGEVLELDI